MGLIGETTINGLNSNTIYSDWKLIVGYDVDDLRVEKNISEFETISQEPIIVLVSSSAAGLNSVKVKWEITDVDGTISLIKIIGSDVDEDVTSLGLIGETTINGLNSNTTYSDWKLIVTYNNDGSEKTLEKNIESFNFKSNNFPWQWIILIIILFLLILFLLISWWKNKKFNKNIIILT